MLLRKQPQTRSSEARHSCRIHACKRSAPRWGTVQMRPNANTAQIAPRTFTNSVHNTNLVQISYASSVIAKLRILTRIWAALIFLWAFTTVPRCDAAGVTIITHGFSGNADGWVLGMAQRIAQYSRFPGTNIICYEITATYNNDFIVTSRKVAGGNPANDPTAEIVIKLDWGALAGFFDQYDTYEVAAAVVPKLLQTNFIAELNGHALAELPLHLIGHSRGGSLVCEMSRGLGANGVWVDHVTTLDPHPVNEDGNSDPLLVSDAPLRIYDNVLFADNIFQEFGGYPHGQFMPSSFNRQLTALPGGYSSAHSDTHLWYHATIDLRDPANDTEGSLAGTDRAAWFTSYESNGLRAGFYHSLIGGGDRLSVDRPAGPQSDYPRYGYNQRWDLGAGATNNRTPLLINAGNWPNLIQFRLAGPNLMAQGQTNIVALSYQWAKPASSNAAVSIYLDDDSNPFNQNERIVGQFTLPGTTSNNVGFATLDINIARTSTLPGVHFLYAKISANGNTRYLYAPELLTVFSSFQPPQLQIVRQPNSQIQLDILGLAGQRIVLQSATNFPSWQPIATNWLTTNRWTYPLPSIAQPARFYRAALQ
jgi:hypothetical protein